ncbi:Fc.00g036070.m01.CDS01 [Cosmosporella sp. VM-42]
MARQRSMARAPARPTASKPAPAPQQTRPAATMAAPPPHAAAPPPPMAAPQGPGMLGQIATTAAGVAIGSSMGHAITGLFSGGSSEPAAAAAPVQAAAAQEQPWAQNNCAGATKAFTQCMDEQQGNMSICNWYLEQLKACQAAANQ